MFVVSDTWEAHDQPLAAAPCQPCSGDPELALPGKTPSCGRGQALSASLPTQGTCLKSSLPGSLFLLFWQGLLASPTGLAREVREGDCQRGFWLWGNPERVEVCRAASSLQRRASGAPFHVCGDTVAPAPCSTQPLPISGAKFACRSFGGTKKGTSRGSINRCVLEPPLNSPTVAR